MDELLQRFNFDIKLHELSMEHSKNKGMKLNNLNVLFEPTSWDILSNLIENGNYHPGISTQHYKDKTTGDDITYAQAMMYKKQGRKVRELNVLPLLDRVVFNAFYQIISDEFGKYIHSSCVSYRKGIGTSKIINKLSKQLSEMKTYNGVKGDLEKFFDRVPIGVIDETLNWMEQLKPSAIWKPIKECYHDNRLIVNEEIVEHYQSLKQGNPIGCILADLILRDIDEEMTKFDVIYYRYSDDFVIIGKDYQKAFARFKEMLEKKGIKLNDDKTEYISHKDWFEFLGFSIKGSLISVSSKTLRNLKLKIKKNTMCITRQNHRSCTKKELSKMIKELQYYFFTAFAQNQENFGMGVYLFGTVNVEHDLIAIENYIKDCLRAAYTNKSNIYGLGYVHRNKYVIDDKNLGQNIKANNKKTGKGTEDDVLKECGWISLIKMYNDYHTNKEVFENSVYRMSIGLL